MNILEGREKLKETSDKFGEQLSEGERIQEEGEETDRIAASIDGTGLDSDTIEAIAQANSDLSGAYTEKIGEVESAVEETADTAQGHVESLTENKERVDSNAEKFAEMAGVSEIGRAASEAGRGKMESDSQQYEELVRENEQQMEKSRSEAKNMSSVISGLFRRG